MKSRKVRLIASLSVIAIVATPIGPADARLKPRCAPSEVRALVRDFIDSYNRGDIARLDKIWAQEPDFFWYFDASDPSRRRLSEDRTTLMAHFLYRNTLGDHLRLHELSLRFQSGWHGAWGIAFSGRRVSDDPAATERFHGKAAATCQRLHAWAMGRDAEQRVRSYI